MIAKYKVQWISDRLSESSLSVSVMTVKMYA